MGTDSGAYKVVLVFHILTVVFGFGPLVLASLYDTESSKRGRQHAFAVGEVQFAVLKVASYVVYLIFLTGIALVMMSDKAWKFDSLWVSLAMLSYIVAIGVWHGMLVPNERRMNVLRRDLAQMDGEVLDGPPEQAVELADRTKRATAMGTVLDLVFVFIIYLMVFKPGG